MFHSKCFKICHTFGIRQSSYFLLFVFNFSWKYRAHFEYISLEAFHLAESFLFLKSTYSLLLMWRREKGGTLRHLLLGDFAIEVLAATHNLHFLHLFKFKSYLSIHHQFTCLFIFGNGFFFGRIMMREKRDGTYS